jgi:glycosyltransferase involved in cell wall biosynthesis
MRILFYYYAGGGGGLSNIIVLLNSIARCHPEVSIQIVTSPRVSFGILEEAPNVRINRMRITGIQEVDRFLIGSFVLPRMASAVNQDILWSINLGCYFRIPLPTVLSVHNAHQVYPWAVTRTHPRQRWRVAVLRWFFRRSLRCSDAVIVQTAIMGNAVRGIGGAPTEICIAPKAVERECDVEAKPLTRAIADALDGGMGRETFTFLYVATWEPHKNHAILIRAFSKLARKNVRVRVVVTISAEELLSAGWPETEFLIGRGYVSPVGWVEKAQVRDLYARCDACLMPSVLESLSSAHIEAMQWGKPQVTVDLPYAHDLCGAAALYAGGDDCDAWVRGVERIMQEEPVRSQLRKAGYERMAHFPASWDDASQRVFSCLDKVRRLVNARGGEG